MRVLDLFSGIGGFSLGLERAGMRTVAFCECEEFPRRVLAKHWPGVPIYDDVRTLTADALARDGIAADVICGGFPCQDISNAGKGAGLAGERSGLWREYARLIGELRPRYVIVENVAALLGRGLGTVLGDLAALGYNAEWHCIPAAAVGAPHRRDRIWIVAYPDNTGCERARPAQSARRQPGAEFARNGADVADANGGRCSVAARREVEQPRRTEAIGASQIVSDAALPRLALWEMLCRHDGEEQPSAFRGDWWHAEPNVGRVAHGVPDQVERIRALGNAVVPQIPELIGRAIMAIEVQ